MKLTTVIASAVVAGLILAGCGELGADDEEGLGDAGVAERFEEKRDVWVMPNLFPNLSGVCISGDLVLVTTREAPPVVIVDSGHCE